MPYSFGDPPKFKPGKDLQVMYDTFEGGWVNFARPTELEPDELAQADNIMLVGKGTPSGRWGSQKYYLSGETGKNRFLGAFYKSQTSTNRLLSITDDGILSYRSGASYAYITGASFPSGSIVDGTQLGGNFYLQGGPSRTLVRFDGTSLVEYNTLTTPANVLVTNLSGVSGTKVQGYRVSANSDAGETLASTSVQLVNLPQNLADTSVQITWNTVSAPSGTLKSYSLYRGNPGDETWIATVGADETQFLDDGVQQSDTIFPANSNTTGGPRAKYILKYDDRLVLAGFEDEPSLVLISGRYPYQDRFNWADGGGFIYVDPDGGEDITALAQAGTQGSDNVASSILVFKDNSVHRIVLNTVNLGNFVVLDPQVQILTSSNGASSHRSVTPVENDTFYFGRKGLYSVGQEANFLNQIRTNEISARIRPYIESLSKTDFDEANSSYISNKYLLSFPSRKETIVYDRERRCFLGPWKTPWGITQWLKYYNPAGNEKWLAAVSNTKPEVWEFSESLQNDGGTARSLIARTKKEDLDSWSIMKIIKLVYVLFRNVRGQVTVNIRLETRSGLTVTQKSFTLTSTLGSAGFGTNQWGLIEYGNTTGSVSLSGDELVRWTQLYKQARVIQLEVISTGTNSNWEFLGTRFTAQPLGDSSLSSDTRV